MLTLSLLTDRQLLAEVIDASDKLMELMKRRKGMHEKIPQDTQTRLRELLKEFENRRKNLSANNN